MLDLIASQDPAAVAVRAGDTALTYGELWQRSADVAGYLLASGVGPDSVVGLRLDRSVDFVAAVLGVWRAGAAYLPLDPEFPAERLAFMVADAGAVLILESGLELPSYDGVLPAVRGGQAAYVIYTSGSTGVPKGVVVPHAGVLNLAVQIAPKLGRVALQFASFSFDAAVIDLAGVLTVGGTLVMASAAERAEPRALAALIRAEGVTAASVVPSLLSQLDPVEVPGVGSWIVGSERVSGGLARSWSVGARVFNAYGPTEVSVLATTMDCAGDAVGDPPIGGPLGNVQVYVLDVVLNPVPVGVPGEIFIGGVGLARGYVGRPELTAERFVAGPGGSRLYRSGDVARWRADGVLEFVGRADDQVKVRGFRVEPGEVEATLRASASVADAAVVAEDGRLIAYVVPAGNESLSVEALRVWVGARLPEYMVPGVFVELAALPRNRNGKVDR
ncbi:amino acid adenylation domain-containing protein, partial [Dactylosporangium sp. NPDC049140]|uniref:amino acid adenylation domain-containing protein n=1 Tax=Dactylosporangium sp. NPDC049140 TaxID=3155647 RepID=UPI00340E97D4